MIAGGSTLCSGGYFGNIKKVALAVADSLTGGDTAVSSGWAQVVIIDLMGFVHGVLLPVGTAANNRLISKINKLQGHFQIRLARASPSLPAGRHVFFRSP